MANGDAYARILKIMERKGSSKNGYDMSVAEIISVKPLQIAINGIITTPEIASNLICSRLMVSDKDEELEAILEKEKYISTELKQFLKGMYQELRVEPGDKVLVQRVKNSFCLCGKVGNDG